MDCILIEVLIFYYEPESNIKSSIGINYTYLFIYLINLSHKYTRCLHQT